MVWGLGFRCLEILGVFWVWDLGFILGCKTDV